MGHPFPHPKRTMDFQIIRTSEVVLSHKEQSEYGSLMYVLFTKRGWTAKRLHLDCCFFFFFRWYQVDQCLVFIIGSTTKYRLPRCSMYGIFAYVYPSFWLTCRYIFQHHDSHLANISTDKTPFLEREYSPSETNTI